MVISKKSSLLALTAMAIIALSAAPALALVIYSDDFTGITGTAVGGGWSAASGAPLISQAPLSPNQQFLGTDQNLGISNNTMTLNLSGLSGYTSATVSFDLYIIHSWDGNNTSLDGSTPRGPDTWQLVIGGTTYVDTTFSNVTTISGYNQSYSTTNPIGSGYFAPKTGSVATGSLTYDNYLGQYGTDTTYHFSFNVPLTGDTLAIMFIGGPTQPIADESWGLDNVKVNAVPLPASILFLGSGLLGLGAVGWRRKRA